MSDATTNRVLPPGSQFNAIVNGKPTGLAGCTRAAECARAHQCLRADAGLPSRFDLCPSILTAQCVVFIPN